MTLNTTTSQVVETSVTVNYNSPIQDYGQPDDHTQPTYEMTPGFKPFTKNNILNQLVDDTIFSLGSCMYVLNQFCVSLCSRLKQTARFDYKTFFLER